jgi:hypothetical protein
MFVLRMKNVRPIGVHHDASFVALGMTVASYMVTGIKNCRGMARFG